VNRPRRVTVTSPQTRLVLTGRRSGPPASLPRLAPAELTTASRVRGVQARRAVITLLGGLLLLAGLPVLLDAAPGLLRVRLWGVPVAWLAVAALPYPVLAGLALWQLRRAEAAERPDHAGAAEQLSAHDCSGSPEWTSTSDDGGGAAG
jgi:hypothetical protein